MAATPYGYNEVQTSPTWMAALPIVAAVTVPFFGMITALLGATWFLGVIMAGFTLVPALHYRNQSEHLARGLITALVLLVGIVLLTIIYPIPGGLIGAPLHGLTVALMGGSGANFGSILLLIIGIVLFALPVWIVLWALIRRQSVLWLIVGVLGTFVTVTFYAQWALNLHL